MNFYLYLSIYFIIHHLNFYLRFIKKIKTLKESKIEINS